MTDANNNPDCVIEITEDNVEAGLKEDDQLQKKYFNGGKVVLTRINTENIKKKQHTVKRPIVKFINFNQYLLFSFYNLGKMGISIFDHNNNCHFWCFNFWLCLFSC